MGGSSGGGGGVGGGGGYDSNSHDIRTFSFMCFNRFRYLADQLATVRENKCCFLLTL